jgi:hypothetical protein
MLMYFYSRSRDLLKRVSTPPDRSDTDVLVFASQFLAAREIFVQIYNHCAIRVVVIATSVKPILNRTDFMS